MNNESSYKALIVGDNSDLRITSDYNPTKFMKVDGEDSISTDSSKCQCDVDFDNGKATMCNYCTGPINIKDNES